MKLLLILIVVAIPWLIGILDLYKTYRFVRKPQVDSTAGFLWYHVITWNLASQTERFVKIFPWISKDLTEAFGVKENADDGRIT